MRTKFLPALIVCMAFSTSSSVRAGPKKISQQTVVVDEQNFRVNRYADDTVKVITFSVFRSGQSYQLRERMRKAASLATNCQIQDDFWLDGQLRGNLACDLNRSIDQ